MDKIRVFHRIPKKQFSFPQADGNRPWACDHRRHDRIGYYFFGLFQDLQIDRQATVFFGVHQFQAA